MAPADAVRQRLPTALLRLAALQLPRRLAGKPLALYVNGRRAEFMVALRRISRAQQPAGWRLEIRPREHAAVEVDAWVVRTDEAEAEAKADQILWWILRRQC